MQRRFHHQPFSCRSDFEETRCVSSFFKSYNSLTFACESYIETTVRLHYGCSTSRHQDKIAASGEGHKPSLDRQKYVMESELALLSILYKLIIIIS